MTAWIIDVQERTGREVVPTEQCSQDRRFRKVFAFYFSDALSKAEREVQILGNLDKILAGQEVIMSDADLDWLVDHDLYPDQVVSVPNPNRCGILDAYIVGMISCHTIHQFRLQHGLAQSI